MTPAEYCRSTDSIDFFEIHHLWRRIRDDASLKKPNPYFLWLTEADVYVKWYGLRWKNLRLVYSNAMTWGYT